MICYVQGWTYKPSGTGHNGGGGPTFPHTSCSPSGGIEQKKVAENKQ